MSRTNLKPASKQTAGRAATIPAIAVSAVLIATFAAGVVWLRSTASPTTAPPTAAAIPLAPSSTAPVSQSTPVQTMVPTESAAPLASAPTPTRPTGDLSPVASAGQRAYLDPKTGRLREAEHDDGVAPTGGAQRRAQRTAGVETRASRSSSSALTAAWGWCLPEELHTFMVAKRLPDGRIVFEHATGPKAARASKVLAHRGPERLLGRRSPMIASARLSSRVLRRAAVVIAATLLLPCHQPGRGHHRHSERQRRRRGLQRSDARGAGRRQPRDDARTAAADRIPASRQHLGRAVEQHRDDRRPGDDGAAHVHGHGRSARVGGPDHGLARLPRRVLHGHLVSRGARQRAHRGRSRTPTAEIRARFNSNLGQTGCLTGVPFYLGLDNNHGAAVDLVTVLLHEFGHGLGLLDDDERLDRQLPGLRLPSTYDHFLFDNTQGLFWTAMTPAQRAASALNTRRVAWTGANVSAVVSRSCCSPARPSS